MVTCIGLYVLIVMQPVKLQKFSEVPAYKGVGRKIFWGGGGQRKKHPKNSKKKIEK